MYQLWISDGFEWFFTVNVLSPKLCPRSIQATHACHSEASFRFFGLWSPRQIVVESCEVGPMFPCNKSHEAMKDCRDWVFSHDGFEVGRPAFQLSMFAKCYALPQRIEKRFLRDVCLRTMLFRASKPTLPTRSLRSLRTAAHFASSALWFHNACKR